MTEEIATPKVEPKYKIKPITKRASQSARKFIRRTKQAARHNDLLPR